MTMGLIKGLKKYDKALKKYNKDFRKYLLGGEGEFKTV